VCRGVRIMCVSHASLCVCGQQKQSVKCADSAFPAAVAVASIASFELPATDERLQSLHSCASQLKHVSTTLCRSVGRLDGRTVGQTDGRSDGRSVGVGVGRSIGQTDGRSVGRSVDRPYQCSVN